MKNSQHMYFALTLLVFLGASVCSADTHTWDGSAGADWFNTNNWTPANVPANGDHVIIDSSAATNVVVSNSTANLASFTITNQTCMFTNWDTTLNATNVSLGTNGIFTLPAAFTNGGMSNRIHIVCTNLTIASGGSIDAEGKGYSKGQGPGATVDHEYSGGAGYGGRGANGYFRAGGSSHMV